MKNSIYLLLVFFTIIMKSQNQRDIFIKDSILPILNSSRIEGRSDYILVKNRINSLEKKYGYEVFLKKRLLDGSYINHDFSFFKKELSILVKKHGFNAIYMKGDEAYFNALMQGNLASWFKKMYIQNHMKWLENNFEKQIDLKQINEINVKDQAMARLGLELYNLTKSDTLLNKEVKNIIEDYNYENLNTLLFISKKYNLLPNDKNFAVIQDSYNSAIIHSFQSKRYLDKVWYLLFPYYRIANLKYEETDVMFRNYDFYAYLNFGYQVFNSFRIQQIPEQFRKNNDEIPIKDKKWLEDLKKELHWD